MNHAKSLEGVPGRFDSFAWIEFNEPLPLIDGNLPRDLQHVQVEKPNVAFTPGGVGLDDLAGYLESGSKQEKTQWSAVMDTIDEERPVMEVALALGQPGRKPGERTLLESVGDVNLKGGC